MLFFLAVIIWTSGISGFLFLPDPVAQVNIDCGKIQGIPDPHFGSYSFRGIPYANPPTGSLRWRPPEAVSKENNNCWNGTFDARKFGNPCFQKASNDTYRGSEDCLYLNVWTPSLNPKAKLPVAVWIHGGFLEYGDGNTNDYSPTSNLSSETNTVYVSMNYRLHAFGFLALEWLADDSQTNTSGNYGFMDMVEALKWVNRNIEMFGGDKNQVTIFGQSSGGTAILALLASPLASRLFHRAWLSSASPILNKTANDAFTDNLVFVNNTGCQSLSCLYALSSEEVTKSIPWDEYPYWAMADQNDLPVKGLFDGALAIVDGYVLKEALFDAWIHGHGNDVPVMIGTTAQETDLSPPDIDNIAFWNQTTYEMNVRRKLSTFSDVIAEMALRLYPFGALTPEYQYTSMTTDLRMNCGNDYAAIILAKSFGSPVFRYVLTYIPSGPITNIIYEHISARYSAHTLDVIGFYGAMDSLIGTLDTADIAWQNVMRSEMISFIKTGTPKSTSWGQFPQHTALLSDMVNVTSGYHSTECQFWLANGFFSYSWIN